jgi:hypothetical protein
VNVNVLFDASYVSRIYFRGVQQIQLRIEGRQNGDLGAVAPYSGVSLNLEMNETHILIRLLRMYIPRNWEFGSALANFGISGATVRRHRTFSLQRLLAAAK